MGGKVAELQEKKRELDQLDRKYAFDKESSKELEHKLKEDIAKLINKYKEQTNKLEKALKVPVNCTKDRKKIVKGGIDSPKSRIESKIIGTQTPVINLRSIKVQSALPTREMNICRLKTYLRNKEKELLNKVHKINIDNLGINEETQNTSNSGTIFPLREESKEQGEIVKEGVLWERGDTIEELEQWIDLEECIHSVKLREIQIDINEFRKKELLLKKLLTTNV